MKMKKDVLKFLNDNYCMINSLMCEKERKIFHGDVVKIIADEVRKQIEVDERK